MARHRLLRVIALATTVVNLFSVLLISVPSEFLTRELGFSAGAVGETSSATTAGGLAGALSPVRWRAVGQARAIWLSTAVTRPFALLWPLAGAGPAAVLFAIGSAVVAAGGVVCNVAQVSRQVICPDRLLGRLI
ncbi:hypothetical protein AB0B07_00080 [Streptomyces sioyaensis]|uniref:hypothetical protein n=1 Tax=Streptomyces sioyaensis TaxID=67364 RepID=UPI0033DE6C4A